MTVQSRKKRLANNLTNLINTRLEEQLKQNLQGFFQVLMNKTLVAFDEYYNPTLLLQGHIDLILAPIHEAHQEYYELLMKANREMFHRGETHAERLVHNIQQKYSMKAAKPVQFLHDNDNKYEQHFGTLPFTEDHLETYTFTASEKTMSRVDEEINQILTTGYREGWGVKDVRNRIMERYQEFQGWEANRIARTEMQTAHNMGVMNQYQEMGVKYKEWRSAHDKRVRGNRKSDRANHIIMDGEIAPLDQPFSNGLMFPGDKTGRIEEWINCRCSAMPYLMSPGTMAPIGQSQFRAADVVSTSEPNYGKLLQKETGGALNWQQYKQILHGKPLEQVLTGVTVAEAKQQQKEEPKPKPVENAPYQLNNRENSYSKVTISNEAFEKVLVYKKKRANAKIEWGNLIDLENGSLTHDKDIKGSKSGVVVRRPPTNNDFGLLHNHPINGGFSGADMFNQMTYQNQTACFATTKDGLWIARDTEFGTFSKSNGGIVGSVASEIRSKMNSKSREISREIYERKYKDRMQNAKTRKEYNAIKEEYTNDPEYLGQYNDWLLDEFGVGKRRDNYFEIEFIPNEVLDNVQF